MRNLILKNIKSNKSSYVLQLLTLTCIVIVMYAFLNLSFSDEFIDISNNLHVFRIVIQILVLLTAYFSGLIVSRVSKYMFLQRNREFATYILLGVKRNVIAKIFLFENVFVSIIANIVGLVLGGIFSKGLSFIINTIFSRDIIRLDFISVKPLLITVLLVFLMVFVSTIQTVKKITKDTIAKILYADTQNETVKQYSDKLNYLFLILSLLLIFASFYFANVILRSSTNVVYGYIVLMVSSLCVGLYFLGKNLTSVLFKMISKNTSYVYQSSRLYVINSIKSNFNSKKRMLSVITIISTISMLSMVVAIIFGAGYKKNLEREYPYDITIGMDIAIENFDDVEDFIASQYTIEDKDFFYLYDLDDTYVALKLSDYNSLRKLLGSTEVSLAKNQYLIHSESRSLREQALSSLGTGDNLLQKYNLEPNNDINVNIPMETYRTVGKYGVVVVVHDNILSQLLPSKSRLVLSIDDEVDTDFKNELRNYINKNFNPNILNQENGKVTMNVSTKAWGVNNSLSAFLMILFIGLYICVILIIYSATILGFDALSQLHCRKKEYTILSKVGFSHRTIKNIIHKEISLIFYYPILLPIVIVGAILLSMRTVFMSVNISSILMLKAFGITLLVFFLLYTAFYKATKFLYIHELK